MSFEETPRGFDLQRYQDFLHRYEQGPPWEEMTYLQAVNLYQELAPHASADAYREAAREAFERMSPSDRREFGRYLHFQALEQQLDLSSMAWGDQDEHLQDPGYLAALLTLMHEQRPTALGQLLAGGGGPILDNKVAESAMAGIAAMIIKRVVTAT